LLKLRGCFVLIAMLLEIVQSVRVSRRAFSHKSEAARSEIYFGSILLTTASGVARN